MVIQIVVLALMAIALPLYFFIVAPFALVANSQSETAQAVGMIILLVESVIVVITIVVSTVLLIKQTVKKVVSPVTQQELDALKHQPGVVGDNSQPRQ